MAKGGVGKAPRTNRTRLPNDYDPGSNFIKVTVLGPEEYTPNGLTWRHTMWLQVPDAFADSIHLAKVGPVAAWLHLCALSWVAREISDGFLPEGKLESLCRVRGLAEIRADGEVRELDPQALVQRLVKVGLWERKPGGYLLTDWILYVKSKAEIEYKRAYMIAKAQIFQERRRKIGIPDDVTLAEARERGLISGGAMGILHPNENSPTDDVTTVEQVLAERGIEPPREVGTVTPPVPTTTSRQTKAPAPKPKPKATPPKRQATRKPSNDAEHDGGLAPRADFVGKSVAAGLTGSNRNPDRGTGSGLDPEDRAPGDTGSVPGDPAPGIQEVVKPGGKTLTEGVPAKRGLGAVGGSGGGSVTPPAPPRVGNERVQQFMDAVKEILPWLTVSMTPRNASAIKHCSQDPKLIARAYVSLRQGKWGSKWLREHVAVWAVVDHLDGYVDTVEPPKESQKAELGGRVARREHNLFEKPHRPEPIRDDTLL